MSDSKPTTKKARPTAAGNAKALEAMQAQQAQILALLQGLQQPTPVAHVDPVASDNPVRVEQEQASARGTEFVQQRENAKSCLRVVKEAFEIKERLGKIKPEKRTAQQQADYQEAKSAHADMREKALVWLLRAYPGLKDMAPKSLTFQTLSGNEIESSKVDCKVSKCGLYLQTYVPVQSIRVVPELPPFKVGGWAKVPLFFLD